jgi:phospholipid N-methyltransferase
MNSIQFLKTALKEYKMVGALTPTSRYAVERIAGEIAAEDKYIVEYGPGDGVITKRILSVLPSDGRLAAIEIDRDFRAELERIQDPRLSVVYDDAAVVSRELADIGLPRIDAVVSGIPFSLMKSQIRREIIRHTHKALRPGGKLIAYQASLLVLPLLKNYFRAVQWRLEPRNLPPYFIMVAKK